MAVSQALVMAVPGSENRFPHACSTVVFVNAFSRPPITMAVKMARKVTVTELPSSIDSLRICPNDPRLASFFSSCFGTAAGPGELGGACSLISRSWFRARFRGRRVRRRLCRVRPAGLPSRHQQAEFLHRYRGRPEAGDPALV